MPALSSSMSSRISSGRKLGGSLRTNAAAVFAHNDRVLLAASGDEIKLISCKSGRRIGSLQGHTDRVNRVVVSSISQAISCSQDGSIRVWKFMSADCERVIQLGGAVKSIELSSDLCTLFAAIRNPTGGFDVVQIPLSSFEVSDALFSVNTLEDFALSPEGDTLVFTSGNELGVYCIDSKQMLKHKHRRFLYSVRFHPSEAYLVTSDIEGKIILWHRFDCVAQKPVTSVLHWHSHKLQALEFSEDGAYLISGGEESVLVLWQMSTGYKHFLPRLGAPIQAIGVAHHGSYYALTCADNTIRLVDAISTQLESEVHGLKCNEHSSLRAVPHTEDVALNGNGSMLQLYDAAMDCHDQAVETFMRNKVSRTDEQRIEPISVERFDFSTDGKWLSVSLGRRSSEHFASTSSLQMWALDAHDQRYRLCSLVDDPHSASRITALAFRPRHHAFVSIAEDHTFRIWETTERKTEPTMDPKRRAPASASSWRCQSIGSYRDLACQALAFSHDGSTLAVAFESLVTLWMPDTLELIHVFVQPPSEEHINHVVFSGQFLIAATAHNLYVWNILAARLWWSAPLEVVSLCGSESGFAVLSKSDVSVYTGDSSTALFSVAVAKQKLSSTVSQRIAFVSPSAIAVITGRNSVTRFDNIFNGGSASSDDVMPGVSLEELSSTTPSPLAQLYGSVITRATYTEAKSSTARSDDDIGGVFSGVSHLLPSLSVLFSAFIKRLLPAVDEVAPEKEVSPEVAARSNRAVSVEEQCETVIADWDDNVFDSIASALDLDVEPTTPPRREVGLKSKTKSTIKSKRSKRAKK